MTAPILHAPDLFAAILLEKMKGLNPAVEDLELDEFRYALHNLVPPDGDWAAVALDTAEEIERRVNSSVFYSAIQIAPERDGRIVLDEAIVHLTNMLFVGLVTGAYAADWIGRHFYFDLRGFFFLHRTVYFTAPVVAHLGGRPFQSFSPRQQQLERCQSIGYRAFREANAEVDQCFIDAVERLIAVKGTPIILAIAGPTAAGKSEIVARLRCVLEKSGHRVTSIEMDNFLTDRDHREKEGIHTLGKKAIHLDLLKQGLEDLGRGTSITTPRYDFVYAISSHDLAGNLKPGAAPLAIKPAGITFIEGNFPFLLEEIAPLIGVKVVYLADDAVRLKRKWKRDIDYRKKYEPTYFRNRFFREQFLMAHNCYLPQLEMCDIVVDTTGAALWATPEIAGILSAA